MYKKNIGRTTYRTSRRSSFKKVGGYQNFKGRNKGNLSQQYNKYLKLAKEAFRSGDRVQSEYYYQFTDHYYRLMVELGINVEENTISEETKPSTSEIELNEGVAYYEKDEDKNDEDKNEDEKKEEASIESISFIAADTKQKKTRSTK